MCVLVVFLFDDGMNCDLYRVVPEAVSTSWLMIEAGLSIGKHASATAPTAPFAQSVSHHYLYKLPPPFTRFSSSPHTQPIPRRHSFFILPSSKSPTYPNQKPSLSNHPVPSYRFSSATEMSPPPSKGNDHGKS